MADRATPHRVAVDDGDLQLYHGDALDVLRSLPAGAAQTCVTSPPYWGLRDYGTGQWEGGDADCDHVQRKNHDHAGDVGERNADGNAFRNSARYVNQGEMTSPTCRCGARRVDQQLGLEASPELYVERMVAVFREVWRVLRDDGTLWLNLGDSYASSPPGNTTKGVSGKSTLNGIASDRYRETLDQGHATKRNTIVAGLKPKDLVGIPWRVAFALQTDGWYLRSDIVWSKPNPMPESVTDRPTKAHEYVFLLSKRPRYFYDADAVREAHVTADDPRARPDYQVKRGRPMPMPDGDTQRIGTVGPSTWPAAGRNLRSVWEVATEPFPEAHFATYPQALVRRCILAGTSERGECSACGAPWVRQVEREAVAKDRQSGRNWLASTEGVVLGRASEPNGGLSRSEYQRAETTGWRPSCSCIDGDGNMLESGIVSTRPQTVLDPFIGSGTTALVARRLGRRCIGIDLSAEYLEIAARRTQQLSLLGGVA